MRKSFVLGKYLFNIQRKNLNHMFFMFLVPLGLFLFNIHRMGFSVNLIGGFIAIAPVQMLLFQFGNTFMMHRQSGSLIKYQLLGFKPIEVMMGIGISTFVFEWVYIIGILVISYVATGMYLPVGQLAVLGGMVVLLNVFEFSLVLFLSTLVSQFQQYSTYATILFYIQLFAIIYFRGATLMYGVMFGTVFLMVIGLKRFKWHVS